MNRLYSHRRPARRGLGLVEMILSLAIAATLLAATGVAVDSSFQAYQINQEQSALMQRCRLGLNRMLMQVRTTTAHLPEDPIEMPSSSLNDAFVSGLVVTGSPSIVMQDDDGVDHAFKWDSANQRLLAGRRNVGQTSFTYYTLLEGVTDFKVKLEPMRSQESIKTGGGYDLLRRVTIELTVRTTSKSASRTETTENQTVTLSASVMPRRNIW